MFLMENLGFCAKTAGLWQLIGRILWIFLIAIPILVIIFGSIDLGKAVVASKDDEIKKAAKSLAMRLIAAVIIWFIPMLVDAVISLVDRDADQVSDYKVCQKCVTSPGGGDCKTAVQAQNGTTDNKKQDN